MSSFGVVEQKNYSFHVPPVCRLIPGRASAALPPRKKSQSASIDSRHWTAPGAAYDPIPDKEYVHSILADAFLPRPLAESEWLFVVSRMVADIALLTATLAGLTLLSGRSMEPSFIGALLVYGFLLASIGYSERLYNSPLQAAPLETAVVGKVVAWATILFASVVRLTNWQVIPADLLLVSAPLNYFAMLGLRRAYKLRGRVQGPSVRNVLIVGAYRLGNEIAQYINQYHPGGRFFRGFLDDSQPLAAEVRGRISDLPKIARAHFIDEVILAMPQQRELAQQLAGEARRNHLDVKIVPDLFGFAPPPDALENYGQVPVVRLHSERPPVLGLLLKRAVDCFAAVIALLLSSPVMLAIAALIKIDSPGPVFYCAPRMGKKGREFLCYKFRTMATNAEAMKEALRATNQREGPFFKMANDPRLTQIGRFLRRYSLDELPQLWNVLAGEMSLVGPRPHPLDDFRRYRLEDFRRLDVTPGITGLWQVTARRDPSFQRSMALDLQYIEQWSVLLDLKILWKTFFVVFHGTGA